MTALGVDVGGTKVLGAAVDPGTGDGPRVLGTVHRPLPHGGAAAVLEGIVGVVRELSAGVGAPEAVGLGLAGFVGYDGVPARSPNVPDIVGADLGGELAALLGLPVAVDNDANCVARAALVAHTGAANLVAVTLGTGIGGGLVVDGRVVRGAHGFAGEPGHMVVDPAGPQCPCGRRGCWERYASGSGLERLAGDSGIVGPGGDPATGEAVVAAARAGDAAALEVAGEFAGWVALGIANLVNLLDPEVVAIGGGLADAGDVFLPAVRSLLRSGPDVACPELVVEVPPWGSASGAVGAALLATAGGGSDP